MTTIMIMPRFSPCDFDYDYDYTKTCDRLKLIMIVIIINNHAFYFHPLVGVEWFWGVHSWAGWYFSWAECERK